MPVEHVVRARPQDFAAVLVSLDNVGPITELLMKLSSTDRPGITYKTESLIDDQFADQGGWRIKLKRTDYPAQFAYIGDRLLVANATYNDGSDEQLPLGWQLTPKSEVFVYGVSAGLAGTTEDFLETFTEKQGD